MPDGLAGSRGRQAVVAVTAGHAIDIPSGAGQCGWSQDQEQSQKQQVAKHEFAFHDFLDSPHSFGQSVVLDSSGTKTATRSPPRAGLGFSFYCFLASQAAVLPAPVETPKSSGPPPTITILAVYPAAA